MSSPEPLDPAIMALATTPFVASWLGRARPGDCHDPDPARRAAAWANWFFSSLSPMTGSADRPYIGARLPGAFYDPKGTGPNLPPHVEVPNYLFDRPDAEFPDRLAQVGNGLHFGWWLVPEVLAAKRALFSVPRTSNADLFDVLNQRRVSLIDSVTSLTATASRLWSEVEEQQVSEPETMSDLAAGDFDADQVAAYFPPAADLGLHIEFDRVLRKTAGAWVSRRVGVWRLVTPTASGDAVLGTITPRLTRSSLFTDPAFAPANDAPAALLVRGLILRRLIASRSTAAAEATVAESAPARPTSAGLRAVVAHVGEKLPEASAKAAVRFLTHYPDPDDAWTALTTWASSRGTTAAPKRAALTVSPDGFAAAHKAALRAIRRAEDPDRDDINVILPLAWDASSRVVRVTYSARDES